MRTDRIVALSAIALAVLYWIATERISEPIIGDPIGPKAIPRLLTIGLVISGILLLIEAFSKNLFDGATNRKTPSGRVDTNAKNTQSNTGKMHLVACVVLLTVVYFSVFRWLGYALTTAVYLSVLMIFFNRGKVWTNIATALSFSFISYILFTRIFGAQIPSGIMPF